MPVYTPKERRAHYTGVANGTIPPKADSKFSAQEQIAYAKGQRDARNDQTMGYLLGKNSPLSAAEKQKLKDNRKATRESYKAQKPAKQTKRVRSASK